MSNDEFTHDWQENFADFEAVLRADNGLEFWDAQAVVRAFQIYQWSGVMTEDVLCLKHEPSGTVVRYDDKYLAIDPGSSDLKEAFPDLFLVLYALGWRKITVFHPLATIQDFLEDMGHGIPANMELEIKAFNRETIRDLPQFTELQAEGQSDRLSPETLAVHATRMQELLRETNDPLPENSVSNFDDIGAEPIVFNVDALVTPPILDDEPELPSPRPDTFMAGKEISQVPEIHSASAPVVQHESHETEKQPAACESFLHLGRCIIAFDTPDNPLSAIDTLAHALKHGIAEGQIKHLRPGSNSNSMHWDVLGEIPDDCPTLAETLVEDMFPDENALHLISALFVAARQQNPKADLRYVLSVLAKESKITDMLKLISEETEVLAASLLYNLSKVKAINVLGTIAVIPSGHAFVDINNMPDTCASFTVRGLAMVDTPEMMVIHTDVLDSQHTHWIVSVLNKLVSRHIQSKRYVKEVPDTHNPLVVIDNELLVHLQKQYEQMAATMKQAGLPLALAA